jgi:hypothetical protein
LILGAKYSVRNLLLYVSAALHTLSFGIITYLLYISLDFVIVISANFAVRIESTQVAMLRFKLHNILSVPGKTDDGRASRDNNLICQQRSKSYRRDFSQEGQSQRK